jgi:altronate hydrolase
MNSVFLLHELDDVAIARHQLLGGTALPGGATSRGLIPPGHKVALHDLSSGHPVRRYNQVIGYATRAITAGEHVHVHNLGLLDDSLNAERDYAYCADLKPDPQPMQAMFQGIVRPDGRVATRNFIAILSTVNCSATVARAIADHFSRRYNPQALKPYPMVDGVIALTHGTGCGMDGEGEGLQVLERTLAGYARHANLGGVLVVGLGCEANQVGVWLKRSHLNEGPLLRTFNIQDSGGTSQTIEQGIELVQGMLPVANDVQRVPCSAQHIVVGLQCGGSDGYSGISANPALGAAVDRLVAHGGTAILSETPEIYGAEHLLTRRAINPEVGKKLVQRIRWWEQYTRINGGKMDNNPSPGNKNGGLTTIFEKSLGAVAKGGTTNLRAVYEYAQPVTEHGFVFMDTPGYDPVSATGQVAGGANLICFTTGRGSAYGCAPAPSLKLSTNNDLFQRQSDDIDINCGEVIDGQINIDQLGQVIFDRILATASGQATKSELHGYGQNEFVPWQLGAVM